MHLLKGIENPLKKILRPYKLIRDPVEGDVLLTSLETKIVNTRVFHRLHQIKQLGCASLVYPGATHTRFSHSIGTLKSAQKLIDAINANPSIETHLDSYATLLTRLCALLHDLSHIPFGHTLEDEGNIFPSQWEDDFRVDYFLGKDSEVGKIVRHETNDRCLNDIVQILTAKSDVDIEKLQYPFIADIIGDTFCADLLDYIRRDSFHVGLRGSPDLRLISYISIDRYGVHGRERIVLRVGNSEGLIRKDIISAVLHLLRLRYHLMVRVIHHRDKLRASAMIINCVYDSLINKKITKEMMCEMGDYDLLHKLEVDGTDLSRRLISKLRGQELHKPILELHYTSMEENLGMKKTKEIFRFYSAPHNRWSLERKLENKYHLPKGSIVIYCPKIKESKKSSTLKVQLADNVFPLGNVPDSSISEEVALIEDHYLRLQKMAVLVDDKLFFSQRLRTDLIEDCMTEFGINSSSGI